MAAPLEFLLPSSYGTESMSLELASNNNNNSREYKKEAKTKRKSSLIHSLGLSN